MQPSKQPPMTGGPIHGVPCPHCGTPNDLRDLDAQNLLDTGNEIVCSPVDGAIGTKHCGRMFVVSRIQMVKVVQVVPSSNQPRRAQQQAMPASTVSPSLLKRLIGR